MSHIHTPPWKANVCVTWAYLYATWRSWAICMCDMTHVTHTYTPMEGKCMCDMGISIRDMTFVSHMYVQHDSYVAHIYTCATWLICRTYIHPHEGHMYVWHGHIYVRLDVRGAYECAIHNVHEYATWCVHYECATRRWSGICMCDMTHMSHIHTPPRRAYVCVTWAYLCATWRSWVICMCNMTLVGHMHVQHDFRGAYEYAIHNVREYATWCAHSWMCDMTFVGHMYVRFMTCMDMRHDAHIHEYVTWRSWGMCMCDMTFLGHVQGNTYENANSSDLSAHERLTCKCVYI